jgi:hypothetical protein
MDTTGLTTAQQKYVESVEHYLKGLTFVSPGLCPSCSECLSSFNYRNYRDEEGDGNEIRTAEEQFAEDIENGEVDDEGGFSSSQCDSCGSTMAGDRYAAHGVGTNGKILHLDVCADCLVYLANGDIPSNPE